MEPETLANESSVWVEGFIGALAAVNPDIEDDRARTIANVLWRTQGRAGVAPDTAMNGWLDSDY